MPLSEDGPTCSNCWEPLNKYWNCLECSNINQWLADKAYEKIKNWVIKKIFLWIFWWKKKKQKNYCECWNEIWKKSVMCNQCYYKHKRNLEI